MVPFCRASMICLCWSRTSRLLCSCSRIAGSCVWKPGDRQARPTSWIARPADSREVSGADGRAVCGPRVFDVLEERSSRLGRGREDDMLGEAGSFLTLIIGGAVVEGLVSTSISGCTFAYREEQHSRIRRAVAIRVRRRSITARPLRRRLRTLRARRGTGSAGNGGEVSRRDAVLDVGRKRGGHGWCSNSGRHFSSSQIGGPCRCSRTGNLQG